MNEDSLQDQINSLKATVCDLVKERENDRDAFTERLDSSEAVLQSLRTMRETKKNSRTLTRNVRVIAFTLICVMFLLFIVALVIVNLSDGKVNNSDQITSIIAAMSTVLGLAGGAIVTGKADKILN